MSFDDPATLADIIDRVLRGNKEEFLHVVRAYQMRVRNYIGLRVYSLEDVDDLLQETFLTAYRRLQDLPPGLAGVNFGGWLLGIAQNKILHYKRNTARRLRAMEEFRDDVTRSVEAELNRVAAATPPDQVERLLECITRLPDRLRRVVRAGLAGVKPAATASELGVTVVAVYNLHHRANRMLRDCVRRERP
jgi:RNA polymerase sigma-70 factor, ECF subfamily